MHLLFLAPDSLPEAVLSTAVVAHFLDRTPDLKTTVAAGPETAPLFGCLPGLERVILLRRKRLRPPGLQIWRACAGQRWDVSADLRGTAATVPLRIGEGFSLPPARPQEAYPDRLARMLGVPETPPRPRLWWARAHARKADALLGDDRSPLLALGPTAAGPESLWPAEQFVETAARLTDTDGPLPGARIAVLGGPDSRLQASPVLRALPRARRIDLAGKVDLPTAAAVLSRCALFIGTDNTAIQMAVAARIPTLGLFGAADGDAHLPRGPASAWLRAPASPTGDVGNAAEAGMSGLHPDTVAAAARRLLEETS